MAESYHAWSPYNYTGGNPIKRIDVNGEFWGTVIKAAKSSYKVGKRVYKTYKKTGKIDVKSIKKAGLDEIYDVVDNVKTLTDGQLTADDAFAAIDLVTGFGSEAKKAAKALDIVDDAGDAKKASKYEDVTKTSRGKESTKNIKTDGSKSDFESNLESGGFEKNVSKDGNATTYTKDGRSYTTRTASDGTKTADFRKDASSKKADIKIRLDED